MRRREFITLSNWRHWFESYEPSSLLCLRDAFDMTGCLARSSSPLGSTTHSHANRVFRRFVS
jgi:hypothetical protein